MRTFTEGGTMQVAYVVRDLVAASTPLRDLRHRAVGHLWFGPRS